MLLRTDTLTSPLLLNAGMWTTARPDDVSMRASLLLTDVMTTETGRSSVPNVIGSSPITVAFSMLSCKPLRRRSAVSAAIHFCNRQDNVTHFVFLYVLLG